MGKSYSNWFSRLLRRKKPPRHQLSPPSFVDELGGGSGYSSINSVDVDVDPEKHAIAVAAATAAVAQAALAAAKAAAEVVRMTRGRRKNIDEFVAAVKIQSAFRGYLARRALRALKGLVKLQALVRGHFVRKRSAEMLRRMQAMFRVQARAVASRTTVQSTVDHPNNNSTTDTTSGTPALMRRNTETQHQARSRRLNEASIFKRCGSVSSARDMRSSSFDLLNQRTQRQEQDTWRMEFDCASHSSMRMAHQTEQEEEEDQILNDKILEIDSSWRPNNTYNHHHPKYYSSMSLSHLKLNNHRQKKPSSNYALSPCDLDLDDVVSLRSLQLFPMESNHYYMGSPQQPYSSRTRTGTGTGSSLRGRKSEGRTTYYSKEAFSSPSMRNRYESAELLGLGSRTRGFVGPDCYINNIGYYHPNYMANTESSRAKVRSQSAPKQRLPELSPERVGSMTNRSINYDCSDFKASSRGGSINSPYI